MDKKDNVNYSINKKKFDAFLADKNISSSVKLLLYHLKSFFQNKNFCYPRQSVVAKQIGLSERQVRNLFSILLENKIIIKKSKGWKDKNSGKTINSSKYILTSKYTTKHNK